MIMINVGWFDNAINHCPLLRDCLFVTLCNDSDLDVDSLSIHCVWQNKINDKARFLVLIEMMSDSKAWGKQNHSTGFILPSFSTFNNSTLSLSPSVRFSTSHYLLLQKLWSYTDYNCISCEYIYKKMVALKIIYIVFSQCALHPSLIFRTNFSVCHIRVVNNFHSN